MRGDATPPLGRLTIRPSEAGRNGGNFEPDKESLQVEMGMSKITELTLEPSSFITAYTGYWLSQKARIRAGQSEV